MILRSFLILLTLFHVNVYAAVVSTINAWLKWKNSLQKCNPRTMWFLSLGIAFRTVSGRSSMARPQKPGSSRGRCRSGPRWTDPLRFAVGRWSLHSGFLRQRTAPRITPASRLDLVLICWTFLGWRCPPFPRLCIRSLIPFGWTMTWRSLSFPRRFRSAGKFHRFSCHRWAMPRKRSRMRPA